MVAQAAGRPPAVEAEGRACAGRTANIPCMSVTLDVSRLSGWLNADEFCREKRARGGGKVGKWSGKGAIRARKGATREVASGRRLVGL